MQYTIQCDSLVKGGHEGSGELDEALDGGAV